TTSRVSQGNSAPASSASRRTGKPSIHGRFDKATSTGMKQNMEMYSHCPLSGMNTNIGRKSTVLNGKSERRIGSHTKAGAAALPGLDTCRVSFAGSTSNAAGSCLQMFQKSRGKTTAHTASTTARGTEYAISAPAPHAIAIKTHRAHIGPAISRTRNDCAASTNTENAAPISTSVAASSAGLPTSTDRESGV